MEKEGEKGKKGLAWDIWKIKKIKEALSRRRSSPTTTTTTSGLCTPEPCEVGEFRFTFRDLFDPDGNPLPFYNLVSGCVRGLSCGVVDARPSAIEVKSVCNTGSGLPAGFGVGVYTSCASANRVFTVDSSCVVQDFKVRCCGCDSVINSILLMSQFPAKAGISKFPFKPLTQDSELAQLKIEYVAAWWALRPWNRPSRQMSEKMLLMNSACVISDGMLSFEPWTFLTGISLSCQETSNPTEILHKFWTGKKDAEQREETWGNQDMPIQSSFAMPVVSVARWEYILAANPRFAMFACDWSCISSWQNSKP